MNLIDRILQNVVFLESRANGITSELIEELATISVDLAEQLKDLIKKGDKSEIKQFLEAVSMELQGTLNVIYSNYGNAMKLGISQAVHAVNKAEVKGIAKDFELPKSSQFYSMPLAQIEKLMEGDIGGKTLDGWVTSFADDFSGEITSTLKDDIRQAISRGLIKGENPRTVAKPVRESLRNALEDNFVPGAGLGEKFRQARNYADVLTRTTMLQVNNDVRIDSLKKAERFIDEYKFLATLDSRTCVRCGSLDGKLYKVLDNVPRPVLHPRCRCQVVPWNEKYANPNAKRPAVIWDEKLVNHRDGTISKKFTKAKSGPVPISTSYADWFKQQDEAFQLKVLGKKRLEWFKAGKLKLKDFATPETTHTLFDLKHKIGELGHDDLKKLVRKAEKLSFEEARDYVQSALRHEAFHDFYLAKTPGNYPVAVFPEGLAEKLGVKSKVLNFSQYTANKQKYGTPKPYFSAGHPDLKADDYFKVQSVLDDPIKEKPDKKYKNNTVLVGGVEGEYYQIVIKVLEDGNFLQNFHRIRRLPKK